MNKGTCKLCAQANKDLRVSHFMPRSLYSHCWIDEYEPVHFSRDVMFPSNRQTTHPLICGDCEQHLSREGENWVLPLLPKLGGPFSLRDRLMKQPPIYQDGQKALYATANNPEIDVQKLIHFAVGVFFKASVHSWASDRTEPHIDLGADADVLRLFLLGQAGLPKHIALCVTIDSSSVILQAMIDPWRGSNLDYEHYFFYVPGMVAQLLIGDGVQESMMRNCINCNGIRPVLVEEVSKIIRDVTREQVASARKTKKLVDITAEIEARGLSIRLGD
jgi:hypothetical protein